METMLDNLSLLELKSHIKEKQNKATHKFEWFCKIRHSWYSAAESGFLFTKTLYLVCHRCGKTDKYMPCMSH